MLFYNFNKFLINYHKVYIIQHMNQHILPKSLKIKIAAWSFWDWGSSAFNTIMTTFVFTVYLTSEAFGEKEKSSAILGYSLGISGLIITILAPILGQRSDHRGRRKFWLAIHTIVVIILCASCFFVLPRPSYLIFGIILIALANIFFELASVNYNAMLPQIASPDNIGLISAIGWSTGYLGAIVYLIIVYIGFIQPEIGWFGVTTENALNIRIVALMTSIWFAFFALPVFYVIPENTDNFIKKNKNYKLKLFTDLNFINSYKKLFVTIKSIYYKTPHTFYFFISSAIFRDGLSAIFNFGAIIAVGSFGFTASDVLLFAIAGNIIAAFGAFLGGPLDDKIGPKKVIIISLCGLNIVGIFMIFLKSFVSFWIFGLCLCLFVGPAQSSSRTFLARITPEGREGEFFGLYATTGRTISFLAPMLFAFFISIFQTQKYGILGIVIVLFLGLLTLIPIKSPKKYI